MKAIRELIGPLLPAFLITLLLTGIAIGQTSSNAPGANIHVFGNVLSTPELVLSTLILIFGLVVIAVEFLLFRHATNHYPEDIFKYLIITLIVIGTLMLVSAGLNNTQIAGATGLFGSIIGYILGRARSSGHRGDGEAQE